MSSSSHSVTAAATVNSATKNATNRLRLPAAIRATRPARWRMPVSAWPAAADTIADISSDPASRRPVSGVAMPTASRPSGRYPNAERTSSERSERSMAWMAAAHRNGSVSSAETAAIRQ